MANFKVIKGKNSYPKPQEISAAYLLADYFHCDVFILSRSSIHTADFLIRGSAWELKSPIGNGKRNIQHQFYKASRQAKNIILDARRSKMPFQQFLSQAKYNLARAKGIKHLLIIDKKENIIKIK